MEQAAQLPLTEVKDPQDLPQPAYALTIAGLPFRFTTANARLMAQKSIEARRLKANPPPLVPLDPVTAKEAEVMKRARVIEGLIDRTMDEYSKATTPRDKQALAMALDRLYGTWSLLTGHERPGVRKSSKSPKSAPTFSNLPEPDAE